MTKRVEPTGGSDIDALHEVMKYSPGDFLIPGADAKGASERIFCRIPPSLKREMDAIVADKRFPFRTPGDVMRWCVYSGLKNLAKLEASPGFLKRAEMHMMVLRDREYWHTFHKWMEEIDKSVNDWKASGAPHRAAGVVLDAIQKAKQVEEENWRENMLTALHERYSGMLAENKGKSSGIGKLFSSGKNGSGSGSE